MKKILFNLLILIVILFSPSIVKAEEYTYTLDNANLLKVETKEYIDQYSGFTISYSILLSFQISASPF